MLKYHYVGSVGNKEGFILFLGYLICEIFYKVFRRFQFIWENLILILYLLCAFSKCWICCNNQNPICSNVQDDDLQMVMTKVWLLWITIVGGIVCEHPCNMCVVSWCNNVGFIIKGVHQVNWNQCMVHLKGLIPTRVYPWFVTISIVMIS
jgi:hypothetical protein